MYGTSRTETKTEYLAEWFKNLPASMVFQPDGKVRHKVAYAQAIGVVKRVIAGPESCHILIDIKRPYIRPLEASND